MGKVSTAWVLGACLLISGGCAEDGVKGSVDGGNGGPDGGGAGDPDAAGGDDGDGGTASARCNMDGVWIVAHYTVSEALSAEQDTVNWFYMDITQDGAEFTVTDSLNCGFRVTGTTTVDLGEDTLEVLAQRESSGPGRKGTFVLNGAGTMCELTLDRTYNLRGADKARFLTDIWQMGDPAKPLAEFPALPADTAGGMEDWDADGNEGITLSSGFGGRYVAQRDWNEYAGAVPPESDEFGGEGVINVDWDIQEAVSEETSPILRTTATPLPPGYARFARVGDELEVVDSELETCRNVQDLAIARFQ